MKLEDLQTEVGRLLARYVEQVKAAGALGQTDINGASDMFLVELFRETFELPNLRSLNAERANFPGLDLGDDIAGRGFQITSDRDLDKMLRTLSVSIRNNLHIKYPHIQVYVTTERQRSYKQQTIDGVTSGALNFDGTKDILDYKDLLKLYKTFELHQLEKIVVILRNHLHPTEDDCSPGLAEALERDVAARFQEAIDRSPFPEVAEQDQFRTLAKQVRPRTHPLALGRDRPSRRLRAFRSHQRRPRHGPLRIGVSRRSALGSRRPPRPITAHRVPV